MTIINSKCIHVWTQTDFHKQIQSHIQQLVIDLMTTHLTTRKWTSDSSADMIARKLKKYSKTLEQHLEAATE